MQGRRDSQAHSIETPSFAHGSNSRHMMAFNKKSKSVERGCGIAHQPSLGFAKMQKMRPVKKRRLGAADMGLYDDQIN